MHHRHPGLLRLSALLAVGPRLRQQRLEGRRGREQLPGLNPQRGRYPDQRHNGDIALTALDTPVVSTIDAGDTGEGFLVVALRLSHVPDSLPHNLKQRVTPGAATAKGSSLRGCSVVHGAHGTQRAVSYSTVATSTGGI